MRWLLIFFILFIPPVEAADIQIVGAQPEVQVPDLRLKIICPKCGYVYYNCDLEEIFKMDTVDFISPKCHPSNSKVSTMKEGIRLKCPFDHAHAWRNGKENGQNATQVFTNKGWMPQRYRPRDQNRRTV